MKTVVGLYEDFTDAQAAIKDLVDSGFDRADISLIASDRETYRTTTTTDTTTAADIDDDLIPDTNQLGEDVAAGMATGGVIGGLGGVLLGLGALAIPGVGPIIAAGPLVAGLAGAGIGAAVGGLVGALVNWGVPPAEAELYAESVRRGHILVGLKTDDSRVDRATDIMNRYDPVDVEERSEYWRSTGWTGYNESAEPWTADQMAADSRNYNDYRDYSFHTPSFREHYTTTYGTTGRDYTWYEPAYRYGYNMAHEDRYADFDTWEEVEQAAGRGECGGTRTEKPQQGGNRRHRGHHRRRHLPDQPAVIEQPAQNLGMQKHPGNTGVGILPRCKLYRQALPVLVRQHNTEQHRSAA